MGWRRTVVLAAALIAPACSSGSTPPVASDGPDRTSAPTWAAPSTTATTTAATTAPVDPAVAAWAEDMQALDEGVRRIHPDPFWREPEAEFAAALAAAPARLAGLDPPDARAEVMRLTAGIDGHSGVYLSDVGFHLYGIHLYDVGGEFAIIRADDQSLVGATVLAIGDTPIADAAERVAPYSPFDNTWTVRLVVPTLLATAEVLHAAGLVDDVDAPHYRVRLADGSERTIEPTRRAWEAAVKLDSRPIGMTQIPDVDALSRLDEAFWTTTLEGVPGGAGRTVYLQYNEVVGTSASGSITELADGIAMTLDAGDVDRLVVDLRYNPGGNDRTYPPLLRVLASHPALQQPGALVVLIGRQTFSAAVLFATELGQLADPVFVGEPTGGSPNLYANPRPVTLPNSGIVVHVSSKYFEVGGPDDTRDTITPDVAVAPILDDLLAGRDPVLAAALALP